MFYVLRRVQHTSKYFRYLTTHSKVLYPPLTKNEVWKPPAYVADNELVEALHHTSQSESINGYYLGYLLQRIYGINQNLEAEDVAKILLACSNVQLKDHAFWELMCSRARVLYLNFQPSTLVKLVDALVRDDGSVVDKVLLNQLLGQVPDKTKSFSAPDIAKVCTVLLRLEMNHPNLAAALCTQAAERPGEFEADDAATVLNTMSKFKIRHSVLGVQLSRALLANPKRSSHQLVNALRVLAFDKGNKVLSMAVFRDVLTHESSMDARDIVALFELVPMQEPDTMQQLKALARKEMGNYDTEILTGLVNSLMEHRIDDKDFLSDICKELVNKFPDLTSWQFVKLYNCVFELKFPKDFAQQLYLRGAEIAPQLNQRGIASILGHPRPHCEKFEAALCKQIYAIAGSFCPYTISRTLHGLASWGVSNKPLITRLCEQASLEMASFEAANIVVTLFGLKKLEERNIPLIAQLCVRTMQLVDSLLPRQVTGILVTLARLSVYDKEVTLVLCERAKTMVFEAQDLADLLFALVVFGNMSPLAEEVPVDEAAAAASMFISIAPFQDQELLNHLYEQAMKVQPGPRALEMMVSALARLGVQNEALISHLRGQILAQINSFEPFQLANMVAAFTKFGHYDEELMTRLCEHNLHTHFSTRNFGLILRSLARCGVQAEPLLKRLCQKLLQTKEVSPSDFAIKLFACGVLKDAARTKYLLERALVLLPEFRTSNILSALQALLKQNIGDSGKLAVQLCRAALAKANEVDAQGIPIVFSALLKYQVNDKTLVSRWASQAVKHIAYFDASDIGAIVYAVAHLQHYDEALMTGLCRQLLLIELTPLSGAACLYGLAKLRVYNYAVVKRCCEALRKEQDFSASLIKETLIALATFGIEDKELVSKLRASITSRVSDFDGDGIVGTLHALLMLQSYDFHVFQVLRNALPQTDGTTSTHKEAAECNLCLSIEQPEWGLLPGFGTAPTPALTTTSFQQHVAQALTSMRVDFSPSLQTKTGMVVPFAMPKSQIAVQLAESKDLFRDSQRPLGSLLFQRRLLRKSGWRVIYVSWSEWGMLKTLRERVAYFRSLLRI